MARCRPYQAAAVMIHDDGEVPLALSMANLVDTDPLQPIQTIQGRLGFRHHSDDHAADRAPGDPEQLRHRRTSRVRRQPSCLIFKGAGKARVVPSPRDGLHNDAVIRAGHTRRLRFEEDLDRSEVQSAPTPGALAGIVPSTPPVALSTPPAATAIRPDRGHERLHLVLEPDPPDHRLLDAEQPTPYTLHAHAEPLLQKLVLDKLDSGRVAGVRSRLGIPGDPSTTSSPPRALVSAQVEPSAGIVAHEPYVPLAAVVTGARAPPESALAMARNTHVRYRDA